MTADKLAAYRCENNHSPAPWIECDCGSKLYARPVPLCPAKVAALEAERDALKAERDIFSAAAAKGLLDIHALRSALAAAKAGGEEWRWLRRGDGCWTRPTAYFPDDQSPRGLQVRTTSAWRDAEASECMDLKGK